MQVAPGLIYTKEIMTKEEALALLKQENVIKNNNKKILEAAFKALNQALKKPEVEENDEE
jgi:hypothetical protein